MASTPGENRCDRWFLIFLFSIQLKYKQEKNIHIEYFNNLSSRLKFHQLYSFWIFVFLAFFIEVPMLIYISSGDEKFDFRLTKEM
jgi:hypothetical protein